MTSQDGSDGRQKTVAELLAQHGGEQGTGAPRRRRRRAEDTNEQTAPQAIIDRVRSDTGRFPAVEAQTAGHRAKEPPTPPTYASPPTAGPAPGPAGQQRPPARKPLTRMTRPAVPQESASGQAAQQQAQVQQQPPQVQAPPQQPRQQTGLGARLAGTPAEPMTEQFRAASTGTDGQQAAAPRSDEPPAGLPRRRGAALEQTQYTPAVEDEDEDEDYLGQDDAEYDEDDYYYDDDEDDDAYLAEDALESGYPPEAGSVREWLSVVGLIAGGVVGGAVVWLGFDWLWGVLPWLWGVLPAAALVAALVVVLMVWLVRRIRHADDAVTTVLAVLAGLFVTVSPAALLLLKR